MSSRFRHDGLDLAFERRGDPSAPPVVLLHGLSDGRSTWTEVADALSAGYCVLALDARGHGESDRAPGGYLIEGYGGDAAAFCREVVGRPALLVGHSLGGLTAAYVAATSPALVRAVFLEDPPLFLGEREAFEATPYAALFPLLQQAIRGAQATPDPEATLRQMLATAPSPRGEGTMADLLGPEGVKRQARTWAMFDPDAFTAAIERTLIAAYDVDTPIRCPLHVVRADPAFGPAFWPEHEERLKRIAPQATVALAAGCGHLIHAEKPAWFRSEVEKFLAAHAG